jgi:DNA-binding MarR family transcriptional regulator
MKETHEPDPEEVRRVADFRLALRRFHATSNRITRRSGLTPRQYLLLLVLEASGRQLTVGELVRALALADGTVTELLDRSERAGLIRRMSPRSDRRVTHVRSTPDGRRRFVRAFNALAREREALAELVGVTLARR